MIDNTQAKLALGKMLMYGTKSYQVDKRLILRYVKIYEKPAGHGVIRNFP
jgi:hypothetical protein